MPHDTPLSLSASSKHALDHDAATFADFVARYKPIVFRWALGMLGSRDDAEDVTQETFVIVWQKLDSVRSDAALNTWMYRITSRVANKHRRQAGRRRLLTSLPWSRPDQNVYTTDPGGRVDRERTLSRILELANALPKRQRELFDLCDMQGLSPQEAAEILDMNPVSARASLFKARAAVRMDLLRTHPRFTEP